MSPWTKSNVSAPGCEKWVLLWEVFSHPLSEVQPRCGRAFHAAQDAGEYQALCLSTSHLLSCDRRCQEE